MTLENKWKINIAETAVLVGARNRAARNITVRFRDKTAKVDLDKLSHIFGVSKLMHWLNVRHSHTENKKSQQT